MQHPPFERPRSVYLCALVDALARRDRKWRQPRRFEVSLRITPSGTERLWLYTSTRFGRELRVSVSEHRDVHVRIESTYSRNFGKRLFEVDLDSVCAMPALLADRVLASEKLVSPGHRDQLSPEFALAMHKVWWPLVRLSRAAQST